MRKRIAALALGMALLSTVVARAAVLIDPYDNALAPDGFYSLLYLNYSHYGEFNGPSGNKASDADFDAMVATVRPLAYFHLGPVPLAFNVFIPFGKLDYKVDDFDFDDDSSGLGDIILGPGVFLYVGEASKTTLSYWFYAFAPTGAWDEDKPINLGQHHWYFEHQLAINQLLGPVVCDVNIDYYHHTEEPDTDIKLPQRFEVAVSVGYQINDKLLVGAHGGGYWDLDNWEVDGSELDDTKARKISIGPTLTYQFTPKFGTSLRWTHDLSAANDFVGDDFWVRLGYSF